MNRRTSRANKKNLKKRADELNKQGSCGSCHECCVNLSIDKLLKAEGKPCHFLAKDGSGCARYDTRPESCRYFLCAWRILNWPEEMRPDKSGVMVYPIHEGPVPALRVMARSLPDLEKNAAFIIEFAAQIKNPVTMRIVGGKQEFVYGNDAQIKTILEGKKHLRVIDGF